MIVIYKDSKQQLEKEYPNMDISIPVIGLDKDIQFYFINELKSPEYDYNFQVLVRLPDELTNDVHPEYSHLKIANRAYKVESKSNDEIIQILNDNLGNYLDSEYLVASRDKHAREMIILFQKESLTVSEKERLNYLLSLNDWLNSNRKLRDERENKFLNTGIFPELDNWIVKP